MLLPTVLWSKYVCHRRDVTFCSFELELLKAVVMPIVARYVGQINCGQPLPGSRCLNRHIEILGTYAGSTDSPGLAASGKQQVQQMQIASARQNTDFAVSHISFPSP